MRDPHRSQTPRRNPKLPPSNHPPSSSNIDIPENIYINSKGITEDDINLFDRDKNQDIGIKGSLPPSPPSPPPPDPEPDLPLIPEVDLKGKFNSQELKFITLYLSTSVSREKAVQKAGFKTKSTEHAKALANRILEKLVSRLDKKAIFRRVGLSEVRIGRMVEHLASQAKSEATRLKALELAAKIMELTREVVEEHKGAEIIITTRSGPPQRSYRPEEEPGPGEPGRPEQVRVQARVISITR